MRQVIVHRLGVLYLVEVPVQPDQPADYHDYSNTYSSDRRHGVLPRLA